MRENGKLLHARRLVARELVDRDVVGKLFETIAPRFAERPGGYTRILRLGYRRGDSAEVAQLELVGSEYDPKAAPKDSQVRVRSETEDRCWRPAARRRRSTARKERRQRGRGEKASKGGQTKGKTAKRTTPQKAG